MKKKDKKVIKWPEWIMLIRHDVSTYNTLREKKMKSDLYLRFLEARRRNIASTETRALAEEVRDTLALGVSDADTPLADTEGKRAHEVGVSLSKGELPDVIFVSPYKRTADTLFHIMRGWPGLEKVKVYEEERIREQEHGLAGLYNDWKVFHALYPEQRLLREQMGPYWYRHPQGENVPDVRERNRSLTTTLVRDFSGKKVLVITHHLNILGFRANHERLNANQFIHIDENDKPINCGVTLYRCNPKQGNNGRLVLDYYNRKLYT
jgi:broad specificity phosphatase PhoE